MMSDDNGQALPRVFSLIRASKVDQVTSQATQCDIVSNACRSLALGDPHFLDEPLGTSGYKGMVRSTTDWSVVPVQPSPWRYADRHRYRQIGTQFYRPVY